MSILISIKNSINKVINLNLIVLGFTLTYCKTNEGKLPDGTQKQKSTESSIGELKLEKKPSTVFLSKEKATSNESVDKYIKKNIYYEIEALEENEEPTDKEEKKKEKEKEKEKDKENKPKQKDNKPSKEGDKEKSESAKEEEKPKKTPITIQFGEHKKNIRLFIKYIKEDRLEEKKNEEKELTTLTSANKAKIKQFLASKGLTDFALSLKFEHNKVHCNKIAIFVPKKTLPPNVPPQYEQIMEMIRPIDIVVYCSENQVKKLKPKTEHIVDLGGDLKEFKDKQKFKKQHVMILEALYNEYEKLEKKGLAPKLEKSSDGDLVLNSIDYKDLDASFKNKVKWIYNMLKSFDDLSFDKKRIIYREFYSENIVNYKFYARGSKFLESGQVFRNPFLDLNIDNAVNTFSQAVLDKLKVDFIKKEDINEKEIKDFFKNSSHNFSPGEQNLFLQKYLFKKAAVRQLPDDKFDLADLLLIKYSLIFDKEVKDFLAELLEIQKFEKDDEKYKNKYSSLKDEIKDLDI